MLCIFCCCGYFLIVKIIFDTNTYFNAEALDKDCFIEIEGKKYYRTKDVGEMTVIGENRHLRVIDRVGSFLKLANGEWMSTSRIHFIYFIIFLQTARLFTSFMYILRHIAQKHRE